MTQAVQLQKVIPGASAYVLGLREALRSGAMKKLGGFALGDLNVEVSADGNSVWAIIRRDGGGGLALRAAHDPSGMLEARKVPAGEGEALRLEAESEIGKHSICFLTSGGGLHRMRMTATLTPSAPLLVPFMPRDLYPLDANDDPIGAEGNVEAAQRGLNSGVLYLRLDEPRFGSVLYFQNFTALNDWMVATDTTPDSAVGGEWPELGFLPPTPPQSGTPPIAPLPAGKEVTTSDAILVFRDWAADKEAEMARQFLQMLGTAYKALRLPDVEYRDWVWRAERTLDDLEHAEPATVTHYGNRYVMPYTDGEYPDLMVQMSVIAGLYDYGKWLGQKLPLETQLKKGLGRFWDSKLETARRYLPNVGKEKDADAVDSWYYYHPLLNMGRMALQGDEQLRDLLIKSAEYGIRAAHHFEYHWPIMYRVDDFSVITKARNDDRFGQTDVGGIYAYVMLQLFELTDEKRYLDEARAAIDAAIGMRFDLMYQANLTAWGSAACMRLWRITNEQQYIDQSYVYLASFFHNCEIWESRLRHAANHKNFLGVTCLHDAPYMAIYECFDSFTAFEDYLSQSGPDLDPEVRMLISEYCKYSLDRAWYYYPDVLPKEMLATEHQSGRIDRELSFPLEDLYGDGQEAGQIGQEIYGCAAAFIYASRSHHVVEDAPFRLFCNLFLRARERTGHNAMSIVLDGGETCTGQLSLVRIKRRKMPKVTLTTADGDAIRPYASDRDRIDFHVPANGRLILSWGTSG